MLTGEQYRDSLRDGRRVYHRGVLVDDLQSVPFFARAIDWIAAGYDDYYDPDPAVRNPRLQPPRSVDELREQVPLVERLDEVLGTTYQSLNALLVARSQLEPDAAERYGPRMAAFVDETTRRDLRIVECITDAKGDRSRHPAEQTDPDAYLRVVERREDGVVIRGAKLHVSGAAFAHELLVLPTKTMRPGEEDYAIACAVPANAPGLHLTTGGYVEGHRDSRDYPVSGVRGPIIESMCIFDDVFVPYERVFLDGETSQAAVFAHALGLWERLGGVAFMVAKADELVGLAQLIAEANGIARISHIREKIDEMIIHATLLRAALDAAIANARATPEGGFYPDDMYTNVAKYLGATRHSAMVSHLHQIAGGSVVTNPSMADVDHPELGPLVEKYMAGADEAGGAYRNRLFHAIRDLTADSYGGWWAVGSIQGGGGLFAQRLITRRLYDLEGAKRRARALVESGRPAPERERT